MYVKFAGINRQFDGRTLFLFIAAVALQLISYVLVLHTAGLRHLDPFQLMGDENSYMLTARNLLYYGTFSYSTEFPLFLDTVRTPGYPFLLAIGYGITRNWYVVTILQSILIAAFLPVTLYAVLKKIRSRFAFAAAVLFMLYPLRIIFSNILMTDSLFTLLFLIGLLLILSWMEKPAGRMRVLIGSGLVFGYGALVRPSGILICGPILVAIVLRLWQEKMGIKKIAMTAGIFAASFVVVFAPWIVRNYVHFGVPSLSVIGTYNMAHTNALLFNVERSGRAEADVRREFDELLPTLRSDQSPSLRMEPIFKKYALEAISSDPFGYIRYQMIKTIPFFIADGLRAPAEYMGLTVPLVVAPNISDFIMHGQFAKIWEYVRTEPLVAILHVTGMIFWGFAWALSILSLIYFIRDPQTRVLGILFVLIFAYFFVVYHGPALQARYRLPIDGLLIFFALTAVDRMVIGKR